MIHMSTSLVGGRRHLHDIREQEAARSIASSSPVPSPLFAPGAVTVRRRSEPVPPHPRVRPPTLWRFPRLNTRPAITAPATKISEDHMNAVV